MSDWVSSDLHFFHRKITEYCPESRGMFQSVDEMNEHVVNTFNDMIQPHETLFILGDISFGSVDKTIELLTRIKCKKFLIHGNHDVKMLQNSVFRNAYPKMRIINDSPYQEIKVDVDGKSHNVVLFHYSIESWHRKHYGAIHLHGHHHSPKAVPHNGRAIDVGLDGNNMKPHNLPDLIRMMLEIPIHSNDHHAG